MRFGACIQRPNYLLRGAADQCALGTEPGQTRIHFQPWTPMRVTLRHSRSADQTTHYAWMANDGSPQKMTPLRQRCPRHRDYAAWHVALRRRAMYHRSLSLTSRVSGRVSRARGSRNRVRCFGKANRQRTGCRKGRCRERNGRRFGHLSFVRVGGI